MMPSSKFKALKIFFILHRIHILQGLVGIPKERTIRIYNTLYLARMSSLISILSTDHGRLRKEEHYVSKRDLLKALRYGQRKRTWGDRWKIGYDGIIFIVNGSLTQEVPILHILRWSPLIRKIELCIDGPKSCS